MKIADKRKAGKRRVLKGLTLLELVVSMAILSLLIGMVSVVSYNYLTISAELLLKQRQEMRNQAFLDWVRRSFGNLPGNAVWQITSTETTSNSPILSEMVLQEFPLTLMWNDAPIQIKAIRIRTIPQTQDFLQIEMECYDEEIFDPTNTETTALKDIDPIASTILLENVRWCEWAIKDSSNEWSNDLNRTDERPYQLELKLAFGLYGENIREVFWIPKRVDPKVRVNEMVAGSQRSGSSSSSRSSGSSSEGGSGRPPEGSGAQGGGAPPSSGGSSGAPAVPSVYNTESTIPLFREERPVRFS